MRGILENNGLAHQIGGLLKRHSPLILTCLGAVGMVATVVTAVKATPKALILVQDEVVRRNEETIKEILDKKQQSESMIINLKPVDTIKATWKVYIPTAVIGGATLFCIFGAHVLNKQTQTALIGAYGLINQAYTRYRKAAKTVYGEDADKNIIAEVIKDSDVWDPTNGCQIYFSGLDDKSEKVLFYDLFSKRYFESTLANVINAEYHANRNLSLRGGVPVNEFYEFLGLEGIDNGDIIGWDINFLSEHETYWIDFDNSYKQGKGEPDCYVISTMFSPQIVDEDVL